MARPIAEVGSTKRYLAAGREPERLFPKVGADRHMQTFTPIAGTLNMRSHRPAIERLRKVAPMKLFTLLGVTVLVLTACSDPKAEIITSGNSVTTTHKVLRYRDGLALARKYCTSRNMEVRHLGTEVRTRAISYFECVEPE